MRRRLSDEQHRRFADFFEIERQVVTPDRIRAVAARVLIAGAVGDIHSRQSFDQPFRLDVHKMIFTGTAVIFLVLICLWIPYLAWRMAKRLAGGPLRMKPTSLFSRVIGTQIFLFAVAWYTAHDN